ncbi:MAG: FtsQ-type POTRA domain-containing protein [Oscillospiraceae bacterium]|nr:FtsQ-type POTRA domain-containing protein [Oscillospiraceae bacterium]MBQ2862126.1 FtsQ-type POTRA domain-containing protein [Oscillospiraceae bacterium]MBQ2997878.1 FtsQ-type POTRA domain-containing protein [Oscillospiraceae bacterium]MBQ3237057.1 FtsQ-type POTRA domain-containing protein [Oscillospiraceae bacterium]
MKFKILKKEKKQTENRFVDNAKKKQRKARKRRKITPFLIVVSLFILAAAVYLCLTMLFNVDRIIIEGNTLYEERELIETSGIEKGENLFEVDTAYAENKLYSVFNYVEAVEVKRSFPNAVTITITEAEPFSVIEEADGYTLVSAGGKVLERGLEEVPYGLLSVRGLSTITSTEDDVKRMDLMQSIINSMKKLEMEGYNFLDLSDTLEIVMIYDDRVRVNLGNELQLEYKLQFADKVITEDLSKTGFQLVDASVPGEVMTKEMTVSPWDTLGRVSGTGYADEDEE